MKLDRSSHRRCFLRKGVLRNFAKFTGKHLFRRLFFNKVAVLRLQLFIKKETLTQVFSSEFCQISPFSQNTSKRLLLVRASFFFLPLRLNEKNKVSYKVLLFEPLSSLYALTKIKINFIYIALAKKC